MSSTHAALRAAPHSGQVVVLDRDGTINVDKHYIADPADLEFAPGAAAGLRLLRQLGCRVVVVTNQSGVGRGLISPMQLFTVNRTLRSMVAATGGLIEAVFVCPHRPDAGCGCRKPAPALIHQAAREIGFDASSVIVVGDKASDVELGRNIGARTMLIGTSHASDEIQPDHVVSGLLDAANLIAAGIAKPAHATDILRG